MQKNLLKIFKMKEGKNEYLHKFCYGVPKAELHIHIEGTFEPELVFEIAKKNNINLSWKSVDELRAKYKFRDLAEFLEIYYEACAVLMDQEDFAKLSNAYGKKAYSQGVKYAEIFFDPQSHLGRVSLETVILGLRKGLDQVKADHPDFDYNLIMSFLRDKPVEEAKKLLKESLSFKQYFIGVGLDSNEKGYPPSLFEEVYKEAKNHGFHLVAHAGEEGPADYVRQAVELLKVERIDHGNNIVQDENLVQDVSKKKIPLTLCPISNLKLKNVPDLTRHQIRELMKKGIVTTVNSDDPSYFGGYVGENYVALSQYLNFNKEEIRNIAINSFKSTFLSQEKKKAYIEMVNNYN